MILILPLLIPIAGVGLLLGWGAGARAGRFAVAVIAAELAAIATVVWQTHQAGVLQFGHYLRVDGLSAFFLVNVALTSALSLVYSLGYLQHAGGGRFTSPRWFYSLFFFFLFTMVGVCVTSNLGLLWIMMEATTLASALLVGFYKTEGAVEAGWKYLIVCTVGIAFALFGTIVLYLVAVKSGLPPDSALDWPVLMGAVSKLAAEPKLLKLAFVFVIVGYGTKIGFVPMHSWLPDAHAEAPSPISAMLSAVLLNCAMYTLMRYHSIISRAAGPGFTGGLLLFFGLTSVVVAGLLIIVQRDLKRLLAYSSVEHMGLIAIGVGLGGPLGTYGALLHSFNHSMGKSMLFFAAGDIRTKMGTLRMDRIDGLAQQLPVTAGALVFGTLAIVGLPPLGLFISEFAILNEAFSQSRFLVVTLVLVTLSVVFGGMFHRLFGMLFGKPESQAFPRMAFTDIAVLSVTAAFLLLFGSYIPASFSALLHRAMAVL